MASRNLMQGLTGNPFGAGGPLARGGTMLSGPNSPTFQSPAINTGKGMPSFMSRLGQNLPGIMTNFSQMFGNRNQPAQPPPSNMPGSSFQRAFMRAMPMNEPLQNRRTDMSQFLRY